MSLVKLLLLGTGLEGMGKSLQKIAKIQYGTEMGFRIHKFREWEWELYDLVGMGCIGNNENYSHTSLVFSVLTIFYLQSLH